MKIQTPDLPRTERRYSPGTVNLRNGGGASGSVQTVRGYAAVFGRRSENLGSEDRRIFEVIAAGAFDDVLGDDVRALFNHNPNLILARSKGGKGTLRLFVDKTGLGYEFPAPETQAGRDLAVSLKRGDVDQSSFGFRVAQGGDRWEEKSDGAGPYVLRTILKIDRLFDVSPVTYPAYTDTAVDLRDLADKYAGAADPSKRHAGFPLRSQWAARLGCL